MRKLTLEELGLPNEDSVYAIFNARMYDSFERYRKKILEKKEKTFEIFLLNTKNSQEYMLLDTTSLPYSEERELYYSFNNAFNAYRLYSNISANLDNIFFEGDEYTYLQNMNYSEEIERIKEQDNILFIQDKNS